MTLLYQVQALENSLEQLGYDLKYLLVGFHPNTKYSRLQHMASLMRAFTKIAAAIQC